MAPNRKPTSVTIRSYQVGFGDCFLVSFNYGEGGQAEHRHVLIDFGSTSLPKSGGFSLDSVAKDIKEQTGGKLTAVVATHRHRDLAGTRRRDGWPRRRPSLRDYRSGGRAARRARGFDRGARADAHAVRRDCAAQGKGRQLARREAPTAEARGMTIPNVGESGRAST